MLSHIKTMAFHFRGHMFSFSTIFLCMFSMASSQLTSNCYESTCPQALSIIRTVVIGAVAKDHRMGASLLRLHFHDCFVNARFLFLRSLINFSDHFQLISCVYIRLNSIRKNIYTSMIGMHLLCFSNCT